MQHVKLIGLGIITCCLGTAGVVAQTVTEFDSQQSVEREDLVVSMAESVYRRLSAIHELMGESNFDGALSRLEALQKQRLTPHELALVFQTFGFVYSQQGKFSAAIPVFERCLELDALPNIAQQGMLYSLSGLYASEGRFEKAIETMRRWFRYEQNPSAEAYMLVGSSYAELERYQESLPYVKRAIEKSEQPKESWYQLELSLLFDQNDYRSALQVLKQMIVYWPDKARYWEMLSSVYLELKQDADALAALMVTYSKGQITEQVKLLNLVKMNLFVEIPYRAGTILENEITSGRVERTQKNLELLLSAWSTAREFDKAIEVIDQLAPMTEDASLYLQKAQILNESGRWAEVVEAATQALQIGGLAKPGDAYILMGMASTELEDYEEALRAFEEARKHDENSRRNAAAWIEYVNDRRQVSVAQR